LADWSTTMIAASMADTINFCFFASISPSSGQAGAVSLPLALLVRSH
jgi:hypothetical protein